MEKSKIISAALPVLSERGCFLVEVTVSSENDIEIIIEKDNGSVDWDDCSAVDKTIHEAFSQDDEDYSLTVSSAGLDRPLKVLRQFLKAVGTTVDVKFKGGKRLIALLVAAEEDGITLSYTTLEVPEGSKKKVKVEHEQKYPFTEINSVTPYIDFK